MTPQEKIAKIQEDYETALSNYAEEYYNTLMLPFCNKWGLNWLSGNGTYAFLHIESNYMIYIDDVYNHDKIYIENKLLKNKKFLKEAKEICDVVDIQLGHNDYFGFYV